MKQNAGYSIILTNFRCPCNSFLPFKCNNSTYYNYKADNLTPFKRNTFHTKKSEYFYQIRYYYLCRNYKNNGFCGPSPCMDCMTVYVINAPATPPRSIYFGVTCATEIRDDSRPVTNHAIRHIISAVA